MIVIVYKQYMKNNRAGYTTDLDCFWSGYHITHTWWLFSITAYYDMAGVYFGTGGGDAIRTAIYILEILQQKETEILILKMHIPWQ
jgi:hypothetical protein